MPKPIPGHPLNKYIHMNNTANNSHNTRSCSLHTTPSPSQPILKPPNRIRIHTQIITPPRLIHPINRHHLQRTHLIQRKPLHTRVALDAKNPVLAVAQPVRRIRQTTLRALVLKERIQATTVNHHVLAIQDAQAERVAGLVGGARGRVVRVAVAV